MISISFQRHSHPLTSLSPLGSVRERSALLRCLLLFFAFFVVATGWSKVMVTVSNPLPMQRHEVVEIPLVSIQDKLQLRENESFKMINAVGKSVDYQITHDRKVLVEATVRPMGKTVFTLEKGKPNAKADTLVQGALYRQRLDDIAWENDCSAYRIYGPALQQTGEKAFGVDVWTKSTPHLVVAERYRLNNYHKDNGNGLDCYNVGPSLGCGAPALMLGDSLVLPYCYKTYRILDNGPLRFCVELTYHPFSYGKQKNITEHRVITLDKGSHFNRMVVWYEGLTQPVTLAAGVVVHQSDTTGVVLGRNYVQYADPTDNVKKHNMQIYVGCIFPQGEVQTQLLWHADIKDVAGHAIGKTLIHPGEKFTYYFGSAWSMYDIPTQAAWQLCINETLQKLQHRCLVKGLTVY